MKVMFMVNELVNIIIHYSVKIQYQMNKYPKRGLMCKNEVGLKIVQRVSPVLVSVSEEMTASKHLHHLH